MTPAQIIAYARKVSYATASELVEDRDFARGEAFVQAVAFDQARATVRQLLGIIGQMTATAAGVAEGIDQMLEDENASRQAVAETAAAKLREIAQQGGVS